MTTTSKPDPIAVGQRAVEILNAVEADEAFDRLTSSTALYASCWSTFTGYPIVCNFDLDEDTPGLFTEAMRVLALKAAIYELTSGDEEAAELIVSPPVDEMVHAVLAQFTLCVQLQWRLGIDLVHMTDQERFGWLVNRTVGSATSAGWPGTLMRRAWRSGGVDRGAVARRSVGRRCPAA